MLTPDDQSPLVQIDTPPSDELVIFAANNDPWLKVRVDLACRMSGRELTNESYAEIALALRDSLAVAQYVRASSAGVTEGLLAAAVETLPHPTREVTA